MILTRLEWRWLAVTLAAARLMVPVTSNAQLTVMTSGAFTSAHLELSERFARTSGTKVITAVTTMGVGEASIPSRLRHGETADVVIVDDSSLDVMVREGLVASGSKVVVARSAIGMVVRAGMPKPDISTPARLKQTLLEAKSIAYSASVSGDYLSNELFARLGVAEQVRSKSRRIVGERVAAVVARAEAEIGFQQISELLPVPGVDYVGPLPEELQRVTLFSAGVASRSRNPERAAALIRFYASADAHEVIRRLGLEPPTPSRVPPAEYSSEPMISTAVGFRRLFQYHWIGVPFCRHLATRACVKASVGPAF
jgi:molybdate transport system substrate-binding protein